MFAILFVLITLSLAFCKSSEVKETQLKCANKNFTDLHRPTVVTDYCKTNKCIAKCCPAGKILANNGCVNGTLVYSNITIYKINMNNQTEESGSITFNDFRFVFDDKFLKTDCSQHITLNRLIYILEDGTLKRKGRNRWVAHYDELDYCVEYYLKKKKNVMLVFHLLDPIDTEDASTKKLLEDVLNAMTLTSTVFLFLTLVVYCLVPCLRNINGMMQMAYYGGLMIMFILRYIDNTRTSNKICIYTSPLFYFITVSNFVWLAVMSFNLWWTFRASLLHRPIHRHGEKMKFSTYSLCVYGSTGILTTFNTLVEIYIDNKKHPNFVKPDFRNCMHTTNGVTYYLNIPIGTLITINCLLFIMTLYNIWKLRKGTECFNASESRKNQASLNSFKIYKRISILMGVSWILEVAQMGTDSSYVLILLLNGYNALIGIVIFLMVITDKNTFKKLRARFTNNKLSLNTRKPSTDCSYSRSINKPDTPETFQAIELSSKV